MIPRSTVSALAGATLLLSALPSGAEEQVLDFRLVTQTVSSTRLEAPAEDGRSIHVTKAVGTAVFDDGRIAHKVFAYTGSDGAESGDFAGYSSYIFENGDRLNLKFVGGWSAEGVGGDYEVLSGTGGFEGATGTGRFDATGADWEGATLYKGQFTLEMPGG